MANAVMTHVVFRSIHPSYEIVVPAAEAWGFYDSISRLGQASFNARRALADGLKANLARPDAPLSADAYRALYEIDKAPFANHAPSIEVVAVIWDNEPARRTGAMTYTVWDFEHGIHRLSALGVGAYSGPNYPNPALAGVRASTHLTSGGWVTGINWATRDRAAYPQEA